MLPQGLEQVCVCVTPQTFSGGEGAPCSGSTRPRRKALQLAKNSPKTKTKCRGEALQALVPEATGKKTGGKVSSFSKPSAKSKPSALVKQQKGLRRRRVSSRLRSHLCHLLLLHGCEVVVQSEASELKVFDNHQLFLKPQELFCFSRSASVLSLKSSMTAAKPLEWPKWSSLSRDDCATMLKLLFCLLEHTLLEHNGDVPTTCADLIPVSKDTNLNEDQRLWLGWQALRWCFRRSKHGVPEKSLRGTCRGKSLSTS